MNAKRIIIIGAGIGGLTAGLALQRRGLKVAVYERAPEIREIGAGLLISANARRALLDLGVDDALKAVSSCVPVMHTCHYATGAVIRADQNEQMVRKYGMATLQIRPVNLQRRHAVFSDDLVVLVCPDDRAVGVVASVHDRDAA